MVCVCVFVRACVTDMKLGSCGSGSDCDGGVVAVGLWLLN